MKLSSKRWINKQTDHPSNVKTTPRTNNPCLPVCLSVWSFPRPPEGGKATEYQTNTCDVSDPSRCARKRQCVTSYHLVLPLTLPLLPFNSCSSAPLPCYLSCLLAFLLLFRPPFRLPFPYNFISIVSISLISISLRFHTLIPSVSRYSRDTTMSLIPFTQVQSRPRHTKPYIFIVKCLPLRTSRFPYPWFIVHRIHFVHRILIHQFHTWRCTKIHSTPPKPRLSRLSVRVPELALVSHALPWLSTLGRVSPSPFQENCKISSFFPNYLFIAIHLAVSWA